MNKLLQYSLPLSLLALAACGDNEELDNNSVEATETASENTIAENEATEEFEEGEQREPAPKSVDEYNPTNKEVDLEAPPVEEFDPNDFAKNFEYSSEVETFEMNAGQLKITIPVDKVTRAGNSLRGEWIQRHDIYPYWRDHFNVEDFEELNTLLLEEKGIPLEEAVVPTQYHLHEQNPFAFTYASFNIFSDAEDPEEVFYEVKDKGSERIDLPPEHPFYTRASHAFEREEPFDIIRLETLQDYRYLEYYPNPEDTIGASYVLPLENDLILLIETAYGYDVPTEYIYELYEVLSTLEAIE